METTEQKIARLSAEQIDIVPYDAAWAEWFENEKSRLLSKLPGELIFRIEHFGSTAVPGLAAKPVIDMLVGVVSLDETRHRIVPVLESDGYEYVWRPTTGDDGPPWYAWFIKRDRSGVRTHHLHMVQSEFVEHWNRLLFRDYLIDHPEIARKYERLKMELANRFSTNRAEYTAGKTEFVQDVTCQAIAHYSAHD